MSQVSHGAQDEVHDSTEQILEEHQQIVGFYRMPPNRPMLVPHKVSMSNILGDQLHTISHQNTLQSSSRVHNTMNLSDLNYNRRHLNESEFVQLISSLAVRAIQIHKQYDKFIPNSVSKNFTNSLNISSIPLNSSSKLNQFNVNPLTKLPYLISNKRSTPRQVDYIQSIAQTKATKEGTVLLNNSHR